MGAFPLVDVAPLLDLAASPRAQLAVGGPVEPPAASGFFLVTGHGVEPGLRDDLERLSREFFALPNETKAAISMRHGGLAWRGGSPSVTNSPQASRIARRASTSAPSYPPRTRVARTPLHGANLFPAQPAGIRQVVLRWIDDVGAWATPCCAASRSASASIPAGSRLT